MRARIPFAARDVNEPRSARLPIAFIHQDLGLIDWMTVAENICLTLGFPRRARPDRLARGAQAARARGARDARRRHRPDARVQGLSRTEKSLVAIARALAAEAEVLVLDEPTASLPADEVERLFAALRRLRARGVGMIYVSHRLDEVFGIADRVVVLRDGRVVGEQPVGETTPEELVLLIVGREPSQVFRRPAQRERRRRGCVLGMRDASSVGPVDFDGPRGRDCRPGRPARRRPGRASAGRCSGCCRSSRRDHARRRSARTAPRRAQAMALGIGLVCARPRRGVGRCPASSVRENVFLNPARRRPRPVLVPRAAAARRRRARARPRGRACGRTIRAADRAPVRRQPAEGRRRPLAAPGAQGLCLRGPDGRRRCRRQGGDLPAVRRALQAGAAVVVVSTDFEEVANICHRALVFNRGRIVAELSGRRPVGREADHRGLGRVGGG